MFGTCKIDLVGSDLMVPHLNKKEKVSLATRLWIKKSVIFQSVLCGWLHCFLVAWEVLYQTLSKEIIQMNVLKAFSSCSEEACLFRMYLPTKLYLSHTY